MEIQISSSLVKTESWLSLFLSCSYVMLRTQQKRQEEAGHPIESKARNKDVCVRVHVCVCVCGYVCACFGGGYCWESQIERESEKAWKCEFLLVRQKHYIKQERVLFCVKPQLVFTFHMNCELLLLGGFCYSWGSCFPFIHIFLYTVVTWAASVCSFSMEYKRISQNVKRC